MAGQHQLGQPVRVGQDVVHPFMGGVRDATGIGFPASSHQNGIFPGDIHRAFRAQLQVDTREDTRASAPAGGSNVTVAIGYLKSYESMGNASVQCIAGCSCDEARLVGTWDIRATLVQSIALQVGRAEGRVGNRNNRRQTST